MHLIPRIKLHSRLHSAHFHFPFWERYFTLRNSYAYCCVCERVANSAILLARTLFAVLLLLLILPLFLSHFTAKHARACVCAPFINRISFRFVFVYCCWFYHNYFDVQRMYEFFIQRKRLKLGNRGKVQFRCSSVCVTVIVWTWRIVFIFVKCVCVNGLKCSW